MIEIPVELGARRYVVHLGSGALKRLGAEIARTAPPRVVVVCSARVWRLHRSALGHTLRGRSVSTVMVPDGEGHKSRRSLDRLHDAFLAAKLARDGLVVAVGGGVVGDLAG